MLAVLFLLLTHFLVQGVWWPAQIGLYRWFWLGLSGLIGLVLGDAFLFQAFIWIGPRRSMLLMSLVPVISTLFAWIFLGETLSATELVAVGLTVGGIAWVISESTAANGDHTERRHYWLGILAGIGGAMGQALGLIASKKGMGGDFTPLSANLIRMIVAAVVMWSYTLLSGKGGKTLRVLSDSKASLALLGGAIVGPFLGVWLSLIAINLTRVGIASTLMALSPILVLLPSVWIFKERVGLQAVVGTLIAMGGVAMIFLL